MVCPVAVARFRPPLLTLLAIVVWSLPQPARAEGWRASVVLTTDYVQRGVSQTNGNPAVQGSVAYWHPTGWYAGAWGSNVDTARRYYVPDSAATEINFFLGYGRRLSDDWVIDVKAVRYLYPDDPAPVNYDYTEFAFSAAWRERLYGSLSVSPRTSVLEHVGVARNRTAIAGEFSLQQPLSPWFTWMLGVGYHKLADPPVEGYFYGATSLALQLKRVTFELGHYRTDDNGTKLFGSHLAGNRTVLTAIVTF